MSLDKIKKILGKDLFSKAYYKKEITITDLLLIQFLLIKANIDYDVTFTSKTPRILANIQLTLYFDPNFQISVTITFCE